MAKRKKLSKKGLKVLSESIAPAYYVKHGYPTPVWSIGMRGLYKKAG
jgi:hypothetical protein